MIDSGPAGLRGCGLSQLFSRAGFASMNTAFAFIVANAFIGSRAKDD
jgi:hypothetical protein